MERMFVINKQYHNVIREELKTIEAPSRYFTSLRIPLSWLEEPSKRIKLCTVRTSGYDNGREILCKEDGSDWSSEEINIIDKAVNKELLDISSFDVDDFYGWYGERTITVGSLKKELIEYLKIKK